MLDFASLGRVDLKVVRTIGFTGITRRFGERGTGSRKARSHRSGPARSPERALDEQAPRGRTRTGERPAEPFEQRQDHGRLAKVQMAEASADERVREQLVVPPAIASDAPTDELQTRLGGRRGQVRDQPSIQRVEEA